jgi:cysteinyl-tRNA synthetase
LLHTDKFGGRSWPGEVLRLALLRTHYRQPIDFTVKALEESQHILDDWYRNVIGSVEYTKSDTVIDPIYLEVLTDDFNTPAAMTRLHSLYDYARSTGGHEQLKRKYLFRACARALGFLNMSLDDWFGPRALTVEETRLIDLRLAARAAKNWKESDRIRDELAAMGIALKDNKDGTTTWEVKR